MPISKNLVVSVILYKMALTLLYRKGDEIVLM